MGNHQVLQKEQHQAAVVSFTSSLFILFFRLPYKLNSIKHGKDLWNACDHAILETNLMFLILMQFQVIGWIPYVNYFFLILLDYSSQAFRITPSPRDLSISISLS